MTQPTIGSTMQDQMVRHQHDQDYRLLRGAIERRYELLTSILSPTPIFTTTTPDLWPLYLNNIPESERQIYNCSACCHFLRMYGGLVMIDPQSGQTTPLLWDWNATPYSFQMFVDAAQLAIKQSEVTGVFVTTKQPWGQPETGPWRHLAIGRVAEQHRFRHPVLTAGQYRAMKREDFKTVQHALAEFPLAVLRKTLALLDLDTFYRKEKVTAQARWLTDLSSRLQAAHTPTLRNNLLWHAVALAPEGFCHPRASMLGTLLDDVMAGRSLQSVTARFREKMQPDQYQRPQAPPKEGTIDRAEKLFVELGLEPSLKRRYATMDDIARRLIWKPHVMGQPEATGIFGHLRQPSQPPSMQADSETMTWVKFRDTVLPTATKISLFVPAAPASYGALVTAVDWDAPAILQWDMPEHRNPASWYVYMRGSAPQHWGLETNRWYPVTGICLQPNQWDGEDKHAHNGKGAFLLIEGAADKGQSGVALFPECLKNELREVRSVIEAYSQRGQIMTPSTPPAAGLLLQAGQTRWAKPTVRVQTAHYQHIIVLDRWD